MQKIEETLLKAKSLLPEIIDTQNFFNILFEMNRYFDKQFVKELHSNDNKNLKLNQPQRNLKR